MVVNVNTELRKLRPAELYNLGVILNFSDNWKKLMASVTREGTEDVPKFPGEYISIVEEAARQERKLAAGIFLEEWATMGKKRPTVGLLLDLLMKTHLFRAADYLAQDVLKVAPPQRPAFGPAAAIDVDAVAELLLQQRLNPESTPTDSDFALRTTNQVRLSDVHYPTGVFDSEIGDNSSNNMVGVIDIRYAESKSNQVVEPVQSLVGQTSPKEITDLIKFSAIESQNVQDYPQSDMLKFDSEKIDPKDNKEVFEAVMPNLSILCLSSSAEGDSKAEASWVPPTNAELPSAELPACLGAFGDSPESSTAVDVVGVKPDLCFNRELTSSELPLCINSGVGVCPSGANLTDNSSILSSESLDTQSVECLEVENSPKVAEISVMNSRELPLTVVEFQNR